MLVLPQIIYNGTILSFTFPPVSKPGPQDGTSDERNRVGADSITSSGLKQSITERVEIFRELEMEFVPFTDMAAWAAFIDWAIQGNPFDYYPDVTLSAFDSWTLEDTNWPPKFNFRGFAKFTLKMRKLVS
jgi:hypothetical protein